MAPESWIEGLKGVFSMNLNCTDFELFGLAAQFSQDLSILETRWKELQRQAHPDKFSGKSAAEQRLSMQWSVRINEAYQRLKDPLRRAVYLCALHSVPDPTAKKNNMDALFLSQQIKWREELEDAKTPKDLNEILKNSLEYKRKLLLEIEHFLDLEQDFISAYPLIEKGMFSERFSQEVEKRIDQLR